MSAGPDHLVPLVGRDPELRRLAALARGADQGRLACVVVDGEPGVGKTRLANEALLTKPAAPIVLRAHGHPSGPSIPFGLWAELVDGYFRSRSDQDVLDACGGHVEDLATVVHGAARVAGTTAGPPSVTRVREAFTVVVQRLAASAPVRVLLDDMHLADASSWELLGYLARNLDSSRVLVVICARLGEVEEPQVANQVLFGLEQDGILDRIELGRLSGPEVREVAERALGRSPVPAGLVSWLVRESRGTPLLVLSLLEALVDAHADLDAPELQAVPSSLAARVDSRLAVLDPSSRAVLETLAVAGRAVREDELYLPRAATTKAALNHLLHTRLVTANLPDETYEVCHPLVQDCVYRALEPDRRRALHHALASGLSRAGRVGEAAHHHALSAVAGDQEAVAALVGALRDTWARGAFAEAFQVMAALVRLLPESDPRWLSALDAVPATQEFLSSYNRIAFDVAAGLAFFRRTATALEDHPGRGAAVEARLALVESYLAGLLAWCVGDVDASRVHAMRAAELYRRSGDATAARRASLGVAWLDGLAGRPALQAEKTSALVADAEQAGDLGTMLEGLVSRCATTQFMGDLETLLVASQDLERLAESTGNRARSVFARSLRAYGLALMGDLAGARQQIATLDLAVEDTIAAEVALRLSFLAGDLATVVQEAPSVAVRSGPTQAASLLDYAAVAAAEAGHPATAERFLSQAAAILGNREFWYISDMHRWAEGEVAMFQADSSRAVRLLERACQGLLASGTVTLGGLVLSDLADAASRGGAVDPLHWAADQLQVVAGSINAELYRCLAVLARSEALAATGSDVPLDSLSARGEWLRRLGYPLLAARCFTLLGRCVAATDRAAAVSRLQQAGELYLAAGATSRGRAVLDELGRLGAAGRRAARAVSGPESLTAREREIVDLAASGLTAREIGTRLHIGERTVETHLANAYVKLGVHSRRELASLVASQ